MEFSPKKAGDVLERDLILAACYQIARDRARQLKTQTAPAETLKGDTANAEITSSANDVDASNTPKQDEFMSCSQK